MKTLKEKTIAAKIYNHQEWVEEIGPDNLKSNYEKLLIASGFTIVKYSEHYFPEKGFTCFWLLAESHLAIHTFPDDHKSYVELSSCNKEFLEKFIELNIS